MSQVRKPVTVMVRHVDVNEGDPGFYWLVKLGNGNGMALTVSASEGWGPAVEYARELSALNGWSLDISETEGTP